MDPVYWILTEFLTEFFNFLHLQSLFEGFMWTGFFPMLWAMLLLLTLATQTWCYLCEAKAKKI